MARHRHCCASFWSMDLQHKRAVSYSNKNNSSHNSMRKTSEKPWKSLPTALWHCMQIQSNLKIRSLSSCGARNESESKSLLHTLCHCYS